MLSSHYYYAIFHIILIRVHVSGESAHAHCLATIWRHKLPNEASQKFMSKCSFIMGVMWLWLCLE